MSLEGERSIEIEKIEEMPRKNLDDVKKELAKTFEEKSYRNELIRRLLKEKAQLRRTFAVLLVVSPARFGDIKEKVFVTKNTLYTHLYQLIELGLAKKISVMDLWNKTDLKNENIEVMNKFKEWTSRMAPGQIQYFAGKTNYWILTDLGEDPKITNWVLDLEKELKN
jgi:hypothetical protein